MKKLLLSLTLLFVYNANSQNIDVSELELNFTGDSRPKKLTKGVTKLFFVADDGVHMNELWAHDMVTNTTYLVKDIFSGSSGMDNSILLTIGDILYFTVNQGTQLWRSDGTEAGTYMVKHINDNFWSNNTIPSLFNYNGNLVFSANDGVTGQELWISDGTTNGTVLLKDIRIGANTNSNPSNFATSNGILYFTADNGINGLEVWKSDGTTNGTMLLKDIVPGTVGSIAGGTILPFNNHIYFYASSAANGFELWKSDGTEEGTQLFKDISVGTNSSNYNLIGISNNTYFIFQVDLATTGRELWVSNGTAEGTLLLKDINPSGNGIPANPQFAIFNNNIYFNGFNSTSGEELWVTDGTTAGTLLVKDIYPGTTSSNIETLTATNNYLIFKARNGTNTYNSLWKSDGTTSGTIELKNINFNTISTENVNFVEFNNLVYFPGHNLSNGVELWSTDGTTNNTKIFKDIFHRYSGIFNLIDVVQLNGKIIYTSMTGSKPAQSDGTINGTSVLQNVNAGESGFSDLKVTAFYTKAGDNVFFKANNITNGFELWRTDGTAANTNMVKDIRTGNASSLTNDLLFMECNGIFYFKANDGIHGEELWRSDGTDVGTYMVKDIYPGNSSALNNQTNVYQRDHTIVNHKHFGVLNGLLYFVAEDGTDVSIWRTDGTESGTIKVISSSSFNYSTRIITVANNKIFFRTSQTNLSSPQIWSTDGTQAGTINLGIPALTNGNQFNKHTILDNNLYFTVRLISGGMAVMKSDGTVAGTVVVISNFTSYTYFHSLYACGNFVYFTLSPSYLPGRVLWRTDGTTQGTVLLDDLSSSTFDFFYECDVCHQNNLIYLKRNNDNKIWYVNGNSTNTNSYFTTTVTEAAPFATQSPHEIQSLYESPIGLFFISDSELGGTELYHADFDVALGTNDFNLTAAGNNLVIYPNPTESIIKIKTNNSEEIVRIKIFDLLGKEVYLSNNNTEYELSHLKEGIYIVRAYTALTNYSTKLVIRK